MITNVVILGGHIQALGLVRQIKAIGLSAIIITDDKCSVARWSRDVDMVICYHTKEELIRRIEDLESKYLGMMLFPTSDDYIEMMLEHYNDWKDKCYLAIPMPDIVKIFANKRIAYQYCEQNGIAHPKSYYPNTIDDVQRISQSVQYPCVVKPGVMYSFHRLMGKKAFLVQDESELIHCMERIEQSGFPINLMLIQEFLSGGAKDLYSFATFAVNGRSLVDIQVNRIRQNPMTFGNSTTYAVTSHIPEIDRAARDILRKTHYSGMGEVEFMYDTATGEYKFLEINTRAWKWHTISNQLGFSFIGRWIEYLNGCGNNYPINTNSNAAWVEKLTDTAVVLKEIIHGRMNISDYVKTMLRKKESAVWSWRDPMPAIMYVLLSPMLYIKRY